MELMNAKGTRDYAPEEMIQRQKLINLFTEVFELFGYSPLETPILERFDVLSAKYAGGSDILKETFKLCDQGKRKLGLRYDLTVPFCRFVGMNTQLKMPFKRYQMGAVFRDGPLKLGRMRQFFQCDVDVVGTKSMVADAEIVKITLEFFKRLELDVTVEINNRKVLDGLLEALDIPEEKWLDVILVVDKIKKIERDKILKELKQKGVTKKIGDALLDTFKIEGTNKQKIKTLQDKYKNKTLSEGLKEVEDVLNYVQNKNVVFSVSLARGLAYYTGTVFEGVMKDECFSSSLCGGGRYDKMIGNLLGNEKEFPSVGISFGVESILTVLEMKGKIKGNKTVSQVYVIPIGIEEKVMPVVDEFRKASIKTDMDISGKSISKNLDYADKMGIPFVLFVGKKELEKKKVKLKDMKEGTEDMLSVKDAIKRVLDA
ncbi:MAG: histidine--tRNA ligase [archaeon]